MSGGTPDDPDKGAGAGTTACLGTIRSTTASSGAVGGAHGVAATFGTWTATTDGPAREPGAAEPIPPEWLSGVPLTLAGDLSLLRGLLADVGRLGLGSSGLTIVAMGEIPARGPDHPLGGSVAQPVSVIGHAGSSTAGALPSEATMRLLHLVARAFAPRGYTVMDRSAHGRPTRSQVTVLPHGISVTVGRRASATLRTAEGDWAAACADRVRHWLLANGREEGLRLLDEVLAERTRRS